MRPLLMSGFAINDLASSPSFLSKSAFLLKGVFLLIIAYSLVLSSNLEAAHRLDFFGARVVSQYTLASLVMLMLWWVSLRQNVLNLVPPRNNIISFLVVGVVARLLLLMSDVYTSNDVSRYLFDGRIAFEGFDPYRLAHDAPELSELRAQWSPPDEHAKYVTLYPPMALALFSFAASFGVKGSLLAWKLITLFASIATLLIGAKVLVRANKAQHLPLLALSPLLILEAGEGLHLDIITALAVISAVYFWQAKKLSLVGVFIAVGGALKILPLALLLPFLLCLESWKHRAILFFSAAFTWFAIYLSSVTLGFKPVGSLSIFFEKWRSGSALFLWLEPHMSVLSLVTLLFALVLLAYAGIVFYMLQSRNINDDLILCLQYAMAIPLLVSPVIFPWYLLPLLVLLALRPNLPLIVWSISMPFLYEVLSQFLCCQHWAPADWPVHLIGFSFILAVLFTLVVKPRIANSKKA